MDKILYYCFNNRLHPLGYDVCVSCIFILNNITLPLDNIHHPDFNKPKIILPSIRIPKNKIDFKLPLSPLVTAIDPSTRPAPTFEPPPIPKPTDAPTAATPQPTENSTLETTTVPVNNTATILSLPSLDKQIIPLPPIQPIETQKLPTKKYGKENSPESNPSNIPNPIMDEIKNIKFDNTAAPNHNNISTGSDSSTTASDPSTLPKHDKPSTSTPIVPNQTTNIPTTVPLKPSFPKINPKSKIQPYLNCHLHHL